tara:strand:- start:2308 stop:2490 length:183 start_codon:yes stop_codon:yes gene_type:complete
MIKGNRNNKGGGRYRHTQCHKYIGWRVAGGRLVFIPTEKNIEKIIVSPYYYFYRNKRVGS